MPKASMNKYQFSFDRENQVWATRQRADVKTITIPQPMNEPPDDHFRTGVLAANRLHRRTAVRSAEVIH